MKIQVTIGSRQVSRDDVLRWEDRRIDAAARKLKLPAPKPGPVGDRREALLAAKLELGTDEILNRLARDIRYGDVIARLSGPMSKRRRFSTIDMSVQDADAAQFVAWFNRASEVDGPAMLRACPDHFLIRNGPKGQEVVETTGGSPLATRFNIDYDDTATLRTPTDPAFSIQLAGVARASNGAAIGGVRHQFRGTDSGYHARLRVEFPLPTLPNMISAHRWHLACEFSNWAEAAARQA